MYGVHTWIKLGSNTLVEDFLMQYKNARWTRYGGIDCDIEHPAYGWIPFTATKDDVESFGRALFTELEVSGNVAPFNPDDYPLPPEGVVFVSDKPAPDKE
jgi:hypothetical protein